MVNVNQNLIVIDPVLVCAKYYHNTTFNNFCSLRSPNHSRYKHKKSHRSSKISDPVAEVTNSSSSKPSTPQPSQENTSSQLSVKPVDNPPIAESEKLNSITEKQDVVGEGQSADPVASIDLSESEDASQEETSIEAVMAVQLKIEQEMQKRRQRLEAWRQKMLTDEKTQEEIKKERESPEESEKKTGWSLEDDDEEDQQDAMDTEDGDEEPPVSNDTNEVETSEVKMEDGNAVEATKIESEEEVDPLDAFMAGVQEEVKHIKNQAHKNAGDKFSTSGEIGFI